MPRRPVANDDPSLRSYHLGNEIASAERYAALQAISMYPPSLRRQVVRQSLHGLSESLIAAQLMLPVADVRAIKAAFTEFSEDQAL